MRTSNKILAGLAVLIVLIGLGFLIGARIVIGRIDAGPGGLTAARSFARGNWVEKVYDLKGFDQLKFAGGWRVRVEAGDEYLIEIRTPKDLEENLDVRKKGGTLMIGTRGILDLDGQHFEARIVMPELGSLSASGGFDAEISGFEGREFILEGSGGLNIQARDCDYDELWVKSSGGVNADLWDMPVTDARIESSGALNMTLTMEGGELTGNISGVGSLEYYGKVSRNTLSVSGVSNIRHKE